MDGSASTSTFPSAENQAIGQISDKRKISGSWKIKIKRLASASAAARIPAVYQESPGRPRLNSGSVPLYHLSEIITLADTSKDVKF